MKASRRPWSLGQGVYPWLVGVACLVITFVNGAIFFSFGVFIKPLETDFGWSRAAISGVSTIFLLGYVPGAIVLGRLADRYGPRGVLALAAFLVGVGFLLNSRIESLGFLMFNYALIGLGTGTTFTVPSAVVQRWFVKRKGLMLGVVVAGAGVGGILFAPLANYFVELYGWRNAFLILGLIFGLLMAAAAAGVFHSPERKGLRPYGWQGGAGETTPQPLTSSPGLTTGQAVRTRAFWGLLAIFILNLSPNLFIGFHLVPLATDRGISSAVAAAALGLLAAFNSVGQVVVGGVADRLGWLRTAALASFVAAGAALWLIGIQGPALLYVFVAIYGTFNGGLIPPLFAATSQFFGTRSLAEILGYFIGAEVLLGSLFSLLGGFIFDWTGSYLLALMLAAACFVAAGICSLMLKTPQTKGTGG